jgi:pantoate--beta-alanine ligase
MNITHELNELRRYRWQDSESSWGLVPTMGALHQGHVSLIKQARAENENVGVSIFINPIQFNSPIDLTSYPVSIDHDLQILENEDVDLVWIPNQKDIYPSDFQSYVEVENISRILEGKSRPGHFRGVTTIVAILFNVFQPDKAYFGQKDAQQLFVIKRMVQDLKFNLQIITCPTVRDNDGLAISSRNQNLSSEGRKQARCLFEALSYSKKAIEKGERITSELIKNMQKIIDEFTLAKVDYLSIADPETLNEVEKIQKRCLISLAVFVDNVRLIDNMIIELE